MRRKQESAESSEESAELMRSGITVATTAINWQERRFEHARQSRSIFSVSAWREVGANP